jgi:phage baseplate assembly protein W
MTATPDFVGSGWAFPAGIATTGSVRLVGGEDELDSALRVILSTAPGERVMRPDFGCAMWEQVFAPLGPSTLGLIEQTVRSAIERWEPRVVLDGVTASPDLAEGTVMIEVGYRVRATNDRRNLVYPFYTIPHEERPR